MKNKFALTLAVTILISVVLGCSKINPLSDKSSPSSGSGANKSLTDKGVDTVVGDETTGIPECDEVMDLIATETNNPDDNFVTKAVKATFLNKIKDSIKKAVDENKNNNANSKADLAKTCKDFKQQLIKYKAEEDEKKNK